MSLRMHAEHVELTVRDTGVGIPVEEQPRVFERFHRVRTVRSRSHEGSGIELALVKELVELHGGAVTAASRPGHGATFTIELPRGHAHLDPEEIVSAAETSPTTSPMRTAYVEETLQWPALSSASLPSAGLAVSVAIVDDNADMRDYLSSIMAPHYSITSFANGQEALDSIREAPPDLLVSDVMMPELDGLGLVQALRAAPQTRLVPVLLLSARAGEEASASGLAGGADGYLVKPFSAAALLAQVDALLRRAREHERQNEAELRTALERAGVRGAVSPPL